MFPIIQEHLPITKWLLINSQPLKRANFNFHKNKNIVFKKKIEQLINSKIICSSI